MSDKIESNPPVIRLDPARLLLLGGTAKVAGNPRMIGTKWSPTCKN
jgi:hypothetical protein